MSAPDKNFETLRAEFAIAGHQLYRTAAEDGSVCYFAARWGLVRALGSLDEARLFLQRVTGQRA